MKREIDVRLIGIDQIDDVTTLFDQYRVFYKQSSDIQGAKTFLSERINKKQSIIFVAYANQEAIGFTQLYPLFSSVSMLPTLLLNDLYVKLAYRGAGIGSKLLNRAKEYAISTGHKGLSLETAVDNPAQQLYKREGWSLEDEFLHFFWKNPQL